MSNNVITYYIVDAFTSKPFGGNPAGVVLLDDVFPEVELMSKIATELRYSETAFVIQHSKKEYTIRYFTPNNEVNLCGHATIASFSLLKKIKNASKECLCHTKAGDINIVCGDRVMIQMISPQIEKDILDNEEDEIYHAIGLYGYKPYLPLKIITTGLSDIMIQVPDVVTLNSLRPDMELVSGILTKHNTVSIHVFALSNDGFTAHVRNFSPLYGIPEESATGTSNASLTHYLHSLNVISGVGDYSFIQGEIMGRSSIVLTQIDNHNKISVGGHAVIVAKGELLYN